MKIKGFVGVSLSDWDGKVSSVIFLPRCNLRCPFCYNQSLVPIESYLETNQMWIDGVVITGGEPTLHEDLGLLCERIKKIGLDVKVDTNGTNPAIISSIIQKQFVDYVALDVKAQLIEEKYSEVC